MEEKRRRENLEGDLGYPNLESRQPPLGLPFDCSIGTVLYCLEDSLVWRDG